MDSAGTSVRHRLIVSGLAPLVSVVEVILVNLHKLCLLDASRQFYAAFLDTLTE